MNYYLYVDDIRSNDKFYRTFSAASGVHWHPVILRSYNEFIKFLNYTFSCDKFFLDLDHDLGDYGKDGGDAIKLVDWLAETKRFYPINIHTMNPVGRINMQREIDRYWPT